MAVTAYSGPPGAGKSFALVAEIIVPGVRDGRRVVTNVAGVKPDAVVEYCAAKWPKKADNLGSVVLFDGAKTVELGFFPDPEDAGAAAFIQAGDLIVMDEVRLYWPARGKFPANVMRFLRMHRHYVSQTNGQSTDVVLASQMVTDFHLDFRGLIERNFKFKKLATLGAPTRYVWQSWEGSAQRKGESVSVGRGVYKPEIYNLYSSYSKGSGGEAGVESVTDRRGNIFKSPKLIAIGVGLLVVVVIASIMLVRFFKPPPAVEAQTAVATGSIPVVQPGRDAASLAAAAAATAPPVSSWRISGTIATPGFSAVVLVDKGGNVRYEDASNFTFADGRPVFGLVDGQRALPTGSAVAAAPSMSMFGMGR